MGSRDEADSVGGLQRWLPSVYDRLRASARRRLKQGTPIDAQPTDLVHETVLRLMRLRRIRWLGRTHVLATAMSQMGFALRDRRRAAAADKRGGGERHVSLDENAVFESDADEALALAQALARLERENPRAGTVATARLFEGTEFDVLARELQVSERTVRSDWKWGRAWLARELGSGSDRPEKENADC